MDNNDQKSRIPENSNSKPMDSKRDVEGSPDPKTDQDFPGYPHYPAKEDIMHQDSGNHRVDANVEDLAAGHNASGLNQRFTTGEAQGQPDEARPEAEGENLGGFENTAGEIGTPQNRTDEDPSAGS